MELSTSILPGGLKIEIPLKEAVLAPIFMKIVNADFKVENIEPDSKEGAKAIIDGMFEKPGNIDSYAVQQRIYNCLGWATEKMEVQRNFSDPFAVECVRRGGDLAEYQITLNREFCQRNNIHVSCYFVLDPDGIENWGRVQGRVTDYKPQQCMIRFVPTGPNAEVNEEKLYHVRFNASPFNFRSCDRTLNWLLAFPYTQQIVFPINLPSLISPEEYELAKNIGMPKIEFSSKIDFNPMQREAIYAIVSGHHGQIPFVLHGPPGTGKTTTLVESVRLLLTDKSNFARVLVCTPSNTAADLFALELLKTDSIPEDKMFRMYSLTRNTDEQSKELKSLTCIWEANRATFGIYAKKELLDMKVIISTLSASTYLVSGALKGDFTHIFIDEAGQASELDTLIPLAGLALIDTKIVLAGDAKQLGPVETVEYIYKKNLTKSLMERYSNRDCYKSMDDKRFTCMLEENYRSHPAIIKISSQLFYGNRLCAAEVMGENRNSLCQFSKLPKSDFPIIFHNIESQEGQEANGHSYCNIAEIEVIEEYIEKILSDTDVKPADIGIISPYKYQVRLLREKFLSHPEMTIDSVERFQGSERRVIVVSTVRNKAIGFLDCEKRFNTTIMRAEELLIVVGNHELLSHQSSWKCFVEYCVENGGVVGMAPKLIGVDAKDEGRDSHVSDSGEEGNDESQEREKGHRTTSSSSQSQPGPESSTFKTFENTGFPV